MLLLLALLCSLIPSVVGADAAIDWFIPKGNSLPPQTFTVGDTITFNWSGFHNVLIHPTGTCNKDDANNFDRPGDVSGAQYTFTEDDVGEIVFACDVGAHCARGMIMTVTVVKAADAAIDWFIPEGNSLPSQTFTVGDTITFNWTGIHNVLIHPTGTCDRNDAIDFDPPGTVSGAQYTFTEDDVGEIVFACDVSDHCADGMIMTVTVEAAAAGFGVICFSGDTRVQVENKGSVEMATLEIGDKVLVSGNKYEPVYAFGHRNVGAYADYLEIHSDGTNNPLQISSDHMILSGGEHWVPASVLRVGDTLSKGDGSVVLATEIRDVTRKGIFAPFTASGSIVVNDIVASNYISFQGSEYLKIGEFATPFTFQGLAHTFESAHRLACSSGFVACDQETYADSGVSRWVDIPHQIALWLLQQSAAVTVVLLVPLLAVFGFLSVLEHPVWVFTFLGAVMLARSFRFKNSKTTA